MSNLRPLISGILQAHRQKHNLTQEQAAEEMGLSLRHYCRLEKQQRTANLETIVLICKALKIKPSSILDAS